MDEKAKKKSKEKNAPTELSTKKKCGRHLYEFDTGPKRADPRFMETAGEIDHIGFVKNYAFLQKNRQNELKMMEKAIGEIEDHGEKEIMKKQIQSMRDQYKTNEMKINDVKDRLQWHKEEKERIAMGKKPYWIGKKEMKELQHQKKFEELKESGKLDNYLKKRRKKLISKDRKESLL